MPAFGDDPELVAEYPVEPGSISCSGNQAAREDACKKWIARAIQRSNNNYADIPSMETSDWELNLKTWCTAESLAFNFSKEQRI